jgi:SHS2 domain-containing protein
MMTDIKKVEPVIGEKATIEAQNVGALLYSWIEELLIRLDTEGLLFTRFAIFSIEENEDSFRLTAEMWGEPFDPERHPQKVGVKAITYHLIEIIKKPMDVTVKFILDI